MAVNIVALGAAMSTAIANLQAAITALGTLQGATLPQLAPVQSAARAALPSVAAAVNSLDADIPVTSLAGTVVGMPVPVLVSNLQTYTNEVQALAVAVTTQGYVSRIAVNVGNATG